MSAFENAVDDAERPVPALGTPVLFFKYAVSNPGPNAKQTMGNARREGTLHVNAENLESVVKLVHTVRHFWDYAFMSGPGLAVRSASALPDPTARVESPVKRADVRIVNGIWDAITQTRDASNDVMQFANSLLKTASYRLNVKNKTWYVALEGAGKAAAQPDREKFFDNELTSNLMDRIVEGLLEDGTPSFAFLEDFYENHDKKVLNNWPRNLAATAEWLEKYFNDEPAESGVVPRQLDHSTLRDGLDMLAQLHAMKRGVWKLPESVKKMSEAYIKFVIIQSYLLVERTMYTNLFNPLLWLDLPLAKFLKLYKKLLDEDLVHATTDVYAVGTMPGDETRHVLTRFGNPVRFFDGKLCESVGLTEMPIDEYFEVFEDFNIETDLIRCLEEINAQRVKLAEVMYRKSVTLAIDAALCFTMPEALDHDEIVKNLAQVFGSSFGEQWQDAFKKEQDENGGERPTKALSRAKIAAEFKNHKDWMSYVPKKFHDMVGVDDAGLISIAAKFVPKDHPFHTHIASMKRAACILEPPALPPPPPPPTPPPPPPPPAATAQTKGSRDWVCSVAAAGGSDKVLAPTANRRSEPCGKSKTQGSFVPTSSPTTGRRKTATPLWCTSAYPNRKAIRECTSVFFFASPLGNPSGSSRATTTS